MPFGPYTLTRLSSLQPSLRPIMMRLLERAEEEGIPTELVVGYRSHAEQAALPKTVTSAPPGLSYHQYGLAADVVPKAYLNLPDWNPEGPLWNKLGALGESLGLSWGGRWKKPDRPHFEAKWAPLSELKAYWDKFQQIMPIKVEPTSTALVLIALIGFAWWFWLRPWMQKSGML